MHLEKDDAVRVVQEKAFATGGEALLSVVKELLDDDALRLALGKRFGSYALPAAAHDLAELIVKVTRGKSLEA